MGAVAQDLELVELFLHLNLASKGRKGVVTTILENVM